MLGKNWGILLQTALEAQGTKDVKIYSSNINHSTNSIYFYYCCSYSHVFLKG